MNEYVLTFEDRVSKSRLTVPARTRSHASLITMALSDSGMKLIGVLNRGPSDESDLTYVISDSGIVRKKLAELADLFDGRIMEKHFAAD